MFGFLAALYSAFHHVPLKPEKHPVDPTDDSYKHGPARKFFRRAKKRTWFQIRKHKNRIARVSRRVNRQRAA